MTKTQLRKKYNELRRNSSKMLDVYLDAALKSGSIDLDSFKDNYILPKAIICAALEDIRGQHRLIDPEHKKLIENIGITTYPDYL